MNALYRPRFVRSVKALKYWISEPWRTMRTQNDAPRRCSTNIVGVSQPLKSAAGPPIPSGAEKLTSLGQRAVPAFYLHRKQLRLIRRRDALPGGGRRGAPCILCSHWHLHLPPRTWSWLPRRRLSWGDNEKKGRTLLRREEKQECAYRRVRASSARRPARRPSATPQPSCMSLFTGRASRHAIASSANTFPTTPTPWERLLRSSVPRSFALISASRTRRARITRHISRAGLKADKGHLHRHLKGFRGRGVSDRVAAPMSTPPGFF
jgi:hypothetical protein